MKKTYQSLFAWLILSSTIGFAAETEYLQGLGDVRYHNSHAEELGRDFHIYVSLPDDYADSGKRYPTIYLLDGGNLFPMLSPYHRYLKFGGEVPDAIVVGISYGSNDFETGNMRSTDYTAPSNERAYWGGASAFQTYLEEQLLPFIEENYRSNVERRVLFGQSIGGQFVIYTAMTKPDLFWGHIASNAAMHRNLPFFLEQKNVRLGEGGKTRLFVTSAESDDPRFANPRRQWIEHWSVASFKPWELSVVSLAGHSHMSAPPASFRQGLIWMFAD